MKRRSFTKSVLALQASSWVWSNGLATASAQTAAEPLSRVRPGQAGWPSEARWEGLNTQVGGRLIKVRPSLSACQEAPDGTVCRDVFKELKNPYYIGDNPSLTQTTGWVDAWTSQPSAYAVATKTTDDVVAAVNFARDNDLRLVVRGADIPISVPPTPPIRS
jgi:hypothetical protein